jgi:hypothetical protein
MKIDYLLAKKNLATLWFVLVGLVFILMFIQTLSGKFEDNVNEAWGWLFPTVLPTLSLILTVFVFDIRNTQKQVLKVDRFYFRLVFSLSLFYMILILSILLLQPFFGQPIISLMKGSNIYLGPIQAIITGAMGLFFIKKE